VGAVTSVCIVFNTSFGSKLILYEFQKPEKQAMMMSEIAAEFTLLINSVE
jgi:hypothetical protein